MPCSFTADCQGLGLSVAGRFIRPSLVLGFATDTLMVYLSTEVQLVVASTLGTLSATAAAKGLSIHIRHSFPVQDDFQHRLTEERKTVRYHKSTAFVARVCVSNFIETWRFPVHVGECTLPRFADLKAKSQLQALSNA